jgi:hypothetical protein
VEIARTNRPENPEAKKITVAKIKIVEKESLE